MASGKIADSYGRIEGNTTEQADAEQAYIQSKFEGDETWISLPPELRPESWSKFKNPVCPLNLSLYGHPDSGGYWEKHCEEQLVKGGFVPISDWRSCYWQPRLKLLLTVYVDDFKMSGPKEHMKEGWDIIRENIKIDNPKESNRYLGCQHVLSEDSDGRHISYDVSDFMNQCCLKYFDAAKCGSEDMKKAPTPFLPDEALTAADEESVGELREDACKVLMKILYGARIARFDLLNPTRALASCVTKWTRACDKKLHRLVSYIYHTRDHVLQGTVNDKADDLYLRLYSDADFAGCPNSSRSTSGVFLCLCGPNTLMPLAALSKKQPCVSHSTPEAELVAADLAVRCEGIPALIIWELILGRKMRLVFEEDNQAAIVVMKTGYSAALRHMGRTHKVCLRWLHERVVEHDMEVNYCLTHEQRADIFTKGFTEPIKWAHAIDLIGIRPKDTSPKEESPTTGLADKNRILPPKVVIPKLELSKLGDGLKVPLVPLKPKREPDQSGKENKGPEYSQEPLKKNDTTPKLVSVRTRIVGRAPPQWLGAATSTERPPSPQWMAGAPQLLRPPVGGKLPLVRVGRGGCR